MRRTKNLALKAAIVASGRKQQTIADLAHVDRTLLSHIVTGRRRATASVRRRLAQWLSKPETDLFPDSEVSS